jgi:hypothetical protein
MAAEAALEPSAIPLATVKPIKILEEILVIGFVPRNGSNPLPPAKTLLEIFNLCK